MSDAVVEGYDPAELEIAAEFLTNWLPFLTRGLCPNCSSTLHDRIHGLHPGPSSPDPADAEPGGDPDPAAVQVEQMEPTGSGTGHPSESSKARLSWADMAQEDELEEEEEEDEAAEVEAEVEAEAEEEPPLESSMSVESGEQREESEKKEKPTLSREQREFIRFKNVGRKKDFVCLGRVKGKIVNVVDGLELHTGVFSAAEQKRIVDFVYELQEKGRKGELGDRTYSEPQKWMRGKGRVTIQFGCCYNYATARDGNPPGILQHIVSDPIPQLFKVIIKRLVRWHVLPISCVPDSCIVNIYETGDCIPPHIDNHDFVRPFCTVSFLSECNILFGSDLKIEGPGEFSGSTAIPLPVGSVLVFNGNGADVAKHCVPAVPTKRISITFRKMDENKWPIGFSLEPDLQNIQPLSYDSTSNGPRGQHQKSPIQASKNRRKWKKSAKRSVGVKSEPDLPVAYKQSFPRDQDSHSETSTSSHQIPERKPSRNGLQRGSESSGRISDSMQRADFRGIQRLLGEAGEQMKRHPHSNNQARTNEENSNWNTSDGSLGRRVKMENKHIVMDNEEKPVTIRSHASKPIDPSRIHIQAFNNGRRKVRLSLSDD